MTRERKSDFVALNEYLKNYSIRTIVPVQEYQIELKAVHKAYFSLLTWNAEILHGENKLTNAPSAVSAPFENRLSESFSDIGSAIFNWTHGGYKASRIMVRSGIENFVRCIAGTENADVLQEKNVFKLFETAATLNVFCSSPDVVAQFNKIHSDYKILCLDVHTASDVNMENISFLAEFPRFDAERSRKGSEIICRVIRSFVALLCLIFGKFFHKMHHKNKENIMISIARPLKPIILGGGS